MNERDQFFDAWDNFYIEKAAEGMQIPHCNVPRPVYEELMCQDDNPEVANMIKLIDASSKAERAWNKFVNSNGLQGTVDKFINR